MVGFSIYGAIGGVVGTIGLCLAGIYKELEIEIYKRNL